ncbi:MAG: SMP-30/gluconolactonase/LRE family protein [Aureliella sp.]
MLAQQESYPVPPEAKRSDGVPAGEIKGPFKLTSKLYPGTERDYWVYVPAQYDAQKPACTMIVQDGLNRARGWKLPEVLDNLIHEKDVPVTIGIFVSPGVVAASKADAQPRFNRSFEYDSRGDLYARFLLEELIPIVSKSYKLSTDPNDRLLAGASSGGICAFNAAWERPDAFRRVFSTIGTYIGLRGGDEFPTLIRKFEPRPIRVFLQDGSNDLNIYAGDWWVANQDMLSALKWSGYEVNHVWGEGGHNGKHGAAIIADAMRWIWKDYPKPVSTVKDRASGRRIDLLIENADWEQVSTGHELATAPATNAAGELFFSDSKVERIYRIGDDDKTRIFADQAGKITGLAFGPDGNLYGCQGGQRIVRFDASGKISTLAEQCSCSSLIALPDGIYFTDPSEPTIGFIDYSGNVRKAGQLPAIASCLAATTDHAFLLTGQPESQSTLHVQIAAPGELAHRQEFGYLHMPYLQPYSGCSAVAVDHLSRPIFATNLGLQVMDQLGRVNLILNNPSTVPVTGLTFGGTSQSILFATAGGSVFRRVLNTQGFNSFAAPTKPPKPGL